VAFYIEKMDETSDATTEDDEDIFTEVLKKKRRNAVMLIRMNKFY